MKLPEYLVHPLETFGDDFERLVVAGNRRLSESRVAFVGLARNCAPHLAANLHRLLMLTEGCNAWQLHIETNDNTDNTDQVLMDFCARHREATFTSQRLNRQQFSAEFAGPRTQALAEYRTKCQQWVAENAADADIVVVVDWDAWGGWSHVGFLHGLAHLHETQDAFGMASVSLMQHMHITVDASQKPTLSPGWLHYDAWALRLNSTFDDYTAGMGGWKHQWIPPVGSPPVPVVSAFGGMAIYETAAYLAGTYDGSDCEHVTFHASVAAKTGKRLYLEPSMRMVMHWIPEQDDGGQHDQH